MFAYNSISKLCRISSGNATTLYAKAKFSQRFSNSMSKKKQKQKTSSDLETKNKSILMSTIKKKCLPYGWIKTNTRWGSSCNSFFKKFSAVSLFQWHVKERLLKAISKLWLHKHWQRDKKLNPCCLEGKTELWELPVNLLFGGLASEGWQGNRVSKRSKADKVKLK